MHSMNEQQERLAIKEATHEAMVDVLLALGVDISDPEAVKQMQKDMHWVRSGRRASENMPLYIKRAGLGILSTVLVYVIWAGISPFFR